MTLAESPSALTDVFAALLRGEAVPWSACGRSSTDFVHACHEHELTGLVYDRVRALPADCEWPRDVQEALAQEMRACAAQELVHQRELIAVADALADGSRSPLFVKGTALAYSVYEAPSSRPRIDTDLLISRDRVDHVRRVLEGMGYREPLHCDGDLLFCQFPLLRTTELGVVHRIDCHWKISTQAVFADVLTFDELAERAIPLPALGGHARTLAPVDALLLACIHPVMHHRNREALIWLYDVHLLASALSPPDFERFTRMAVARQVAAICAHQLDAARTRLGTRIPPSTIRELMGVETREASAVYLRRDRRWIDELISSVRGLPRWSDRLRLVREVVLPGPAYMLRAYGFASRSLGVPLLPFLYVHRVVFGGWKLIAGQK